MTERAPLPVAQVASDRGWKEGITPGGPAIAVGYLPEGTSERVARGPDRAIAATGVVPARPHIDHAKAAIVALRLFARTGHPDFLDLPWNEPLEEWEHDRLVEIPAGLHRHVVRFVRYGERLYVLKELPKRYAEREYRFLNHLKEEGVPTVEAVGVVTHRLDADREPLQAVLITKHLAYSLPYRLLFSRRSDPELVTSMIEALANLLVRIHLVGFMWGDCSLSNTLFRRDADQLAAYLIDTETGELHPSLTDGQRSYDLELAVERTAGELLDLQAQGLVPDDLDPADFGLALEATYRMLWSVLTDVEVFHANERYRIHERLERVNRMGYDVGEVELVASPDDPDALELHLHVVEPARHRRLLFERTGLAAEETQARALLNDITRYSCWRQANDGVTLPQERLDRRWYEDSYLALLDRVPDDLWGRREGPQLFLEILGHWARLSAERGHDMPLQDAADDYVGSVLRDASDEVVVEDDDAFSTSDPRELDLL